MKAAAYCRFSSENQRDGYSIEAQLRAINEHCSKSGIILIKTYIDEARSGTSDNREAFQKMIFDAAKKEFDVVIVHKLDRFARDRYDSAIYKKKLKDYGIRLISVLEPLDNSPESIMMESVLEGMAEYYSSNLSREVKKGKNEVARKGLWNGGVIPFGFCSNNRQYTIVSEEESAIKYIFNRYVSGTNSRRIADWLNDQGFKTRRNKPFSRYSIESILINPIYTGYLIYGRNSEEPIKIKVCNPIIEQELFDAVNKKIKTRKIGPIAKTRESHYILTGVLFCGECGGYLRGHKSKNDFINRKGVHIYREYRSYRCQGTRGDAKAKQRIDSSVPTCNLKGIRKEKIEEFVIESIHRNVFSEEGISILTKKIMERSKIKNTSNKNFNNIKRLNIKKDRLLDLFLDGSIDKNTFNAKNNEMEFELDKLKTFNSTSNYSFLIDEKYIKQLIQSYISTKANDSIEYKKLLISSFIDSVYIDNDKLSINYKFSTAEGTNFSEQIIVSNSKFASANVYLSTKYLIRSVENMLFDKIETLHL